MQTLSPEVAQGLADLREAAQRDHLSGAGGSVTVARLSQAADKALTTIWESLDGAAGALLALGEYGRRSTAPGSPIEVMVLRASGSQENPLLEAAFDQLWSAIEIEYRSHAPDEAISLAAQDTQALLSFLDGRFLAGDKDLFRKWSAALVSQAANPTERFLQRLREAPQTRHLRLDDATSGLEPDLNEGKGGLWDLAAIGWIQKVAGPQQLAFEESRLEQAADLLHRIRCQLHWFTGRATDVFEVHYQRPVAEALTDEDPLLSPEIDLMRSLYSGCRDIAFTLDSLLLAPQDRGEDLASAFRDCFSADDGRWNRSCLQAFMRILEAGPIGRLALRSLDATGDLVRAIPQWEKIRCLPQRNIYHRFAVDMHSIETVAAICELPQSADPQIGSIANEIFKDGKQPLLLGSLFHDIGKGNGANHSATGSRLAEEAMQLIGIDPVVASDAAWLVANHLLLTETATKRDIGDEAMVVEMADKVASRRRLRMLYLLSVADAAATGPDAWSTWKATLVTRLFERIDHILEHGRLGGPDAIQLVREKAAAIKTALDNHPGLEQLLAGMPREWLLSQPPSALINQARLMLDFDRRDELAIAAVPYQEAGIWEVNIVATDRPGLFSKVSGALALHDLNIVGADVYTSRDGIALEAIRLEALGEEDLRFEHVTHDALKALHGRLALEARLAQRIAEDPARFAKGNQEAAKVIVDNDASDFYTVIEVHAPDRIGRLFAITRSVAELDIDIHLARVSTYGHDIIDTFYVTDLARKKIVDPQYLAEIEKAILHRLSIH